jgi:hypothetical protein
VIGSVCEAIDAACEGGVIVSGVAFKGAESEMLSARHA